MRDEITRAAEARADHYRAPADRPSQRRAADPTLGALAGAALTPQPPAVRAAGDQPNTGSTVVGYASVTEVGYEMYDMFGPYTEVVSLDAFDATLASDPLVEFTLNHARGGSIPMAHTRNGTLALSAIKTGETTGLWYEAHVDPTRGDVADALKALDRRDLAESSFKFSITRGLWSPDYTEYRIEQVDLNRGDVSAVNFGANPNATAAVREALGDLGAVDLDDLVERLAARLAPARAAHARRLPPVPHRDVRF